ncbi:lipoprotein 17-related variable surface protein [Mycoplasmopsis iners]|uniref:lipoprotein 17-related variable surface protein n=1 Tax=Mycoplasmopsis iners TaxID=76630 RepID=UPI0004982F90|nr:lipoprotein 17-related variable surface protein [Mycoplasmopsis iners]
MNALKDYYDKLPDSLKPNKNGEITNELYVYEKTKSEKDNYKKFIKQTKAVIDDSATTPITNSTEIETLLSDLKDAKSKLDGSSSYLPRQNELKNMTVELKQQLLKEIDTTITDESEKEKRFTLIKALDLGIGKELTKISEWQTNYVADTNVGYKNAIDSLKKAADSLTTKLTTAFNLNLADGNQNKDKFNQVEQTDPNDYSGLYDKALANYKALKNELSKLKSKLDESTRLYNLAINHTNNKPQLFATNVAKNYATDQSPFTVTINDNQPEAVIQNIQVVAANDVDGKLEITYEIVSTKANLTDVKTKVQTYIFKADTQDNYQTETQRLNPIANSINKDQSKISLGFTAANELADSEKAKNKANYSYSNATNDKLTFDITNINPESDFGRSTLNFTLTSTKTKEDLFWRSDNDLTKITYTAPQSDADSVTITGFKNGEKTRLDGLSGYSIDRSDKSKILASKVDLDDLNSDKWTWSPEADGQYTIVDKKVVAYNDITGQIKLGFKLQSTKENLETIKSEEKYVTISGFLTEFRRMNKLVDNATPNSVISQKPGTTNKKPSDLTLADFVTNVPDSLANQNVQINLESVILRYDDTGDACIAYSLTSTRKDLVSNNWEPAVANSDPIKSKISNWAEFHGYLTPRAEEANRLNALKVSYENKNPKLMPSEISATNINSALAVLLPENSEAEVIALTITNQDDRSGSLTISYKLRSTKANLTNAETAVKTYTFKSETKDKYKTEQERIDALSYQPTLSENAKSNKTASEIKPSDIIFATSETDEAHEVKIVSNSINDKTGAFTVEYKIKSKRTGLDDIVSTKARTATFNTLTESQRLDKVINDNTITKEITYTGQKAQNEVLASEVTKWMLSPNQTLLSDSKAKIVITNNVKVDPNNNQQVIVTYNLTSTKDNLTDVTSSITKEITIGGFKKPIDKEAEKTRLNNLTVTLDYENKITTLPSDTVIEKVSATIQEANPEARVVIDSIDTRNEIDGYIGITYHLVSQKSDEIYQGVTSDNKYAQIKGFKTEQMRLDEIMQKLAIEVGIKNIASDQYNKWTASKLLKDLILNKSATNQDTSYNLKVVEKSANDSTGEISYTWQIISNRGTVNSQNLNTVTSSSKYNKSGTLSGFKTLAQIEKERLNSLDFSDKVENGLLYHIDYPNKANEQASSLTDATTQWTWDALNQDNYEFINQQIVGYSDLTGEIRLSFQIKSTKEDFKSVVSDTKEIIISGFETELQRLNKLVDTNPYNISLKDTVDKANKKASTLTKNDFSASIKENANNTSYHISDLLLTDANDNTGQIRVKYKLISDRQVNTDQTGLKKLVSNWKETFKEQQVTSKESSPINFADFLTNTEEEKRRIEDFLPKIALDFENRNQYLPLYNENDVIGSKVIIKLNNNETLEQNNIKVKENSLTITQRDDRDGYIKVTYILQSTKQGLEDAEIVVNETRSANTNKLTGFKTELQRLEDLVIDFNNSVSDKNQKQASDTTITIGNLNQNDAKTTNITISNKTRDDRNGTLSGTYSIYSTRDGFNDIHVDDKKFTINGFLTEQQRINNLLADNTIQANVEYKLDNQTEILPSELLANKDEVLNNLSTYFDMNLDNEAINQADLKIIDLSADDTNGSIIFKYKIASTKENLTDIASEQSKTINLSGFLTELEKHKKEAKKTVDALNNLSENEKAQFKDNIDKSATKNKVNDFVKKAQITDLINQIDKTYPYLNLKQKADLKDSLIKAPNYNQALKKFEAYSPINDKMKKLLDLIDHYDELIADQSNIRYHKAENKADFDEILNKAKELSQSTTDNGQDKYNKFNLNNLIDSPTNTNSLEGAYQRLKGKKIDLIEKINQSDLPQVQKDALIAEVDPIDYNSENAPVSFDNIEDQVDKLIKIKNDQILSDDDKAKLVEDVLANDPTEQNYYETAKNIDKKQNSIDAIRQNENLTNEQRDRISNDIASLDEKVENFNNDLAKENAKADLIAKIQGNNNLTNEEKAKLVDEVNNIANDDAKFYDKLINEKAKLDLIDQLHQEANEGKITEKAKDALINEVLNIANNENTIANIDKVKAKDKLIQQVKASDVLSDKSKDTLINKILDNDASKSDFDDVHKQNAQLFVDAEELAKAKNVLVDLIKSKKFKKLTKDQQDAINKAIADSDEILNNLNSHNNEDVVKQTVIDKELAKLEVDNDWSWILFLIAAIATATSLGLLLAIPAIRNKLLK